MLAHGCALEEGHANRGNAIVSARNPTSHRKCVGRFEKVVLTGHCRRFASKHEHQKSKYLRQAYDTLASQFFRHASERPPLLDHYFLIGRKLSGRGKKQIMNKNNRGE